MSSLFITYIYQPFLNLLVGIYLILQQLPLPHVDMGVAVVIFTIALRILLLPLTISASRSLKERLAIQKQVAQIKAAHPHDPIAVRRQVKALLKSNRRIIIAEIFNLFIQASIALMLWRIFSFGLSGRDLHLLYSFLPPLNQPFNLVFLGRFDLTKPSLILNLLQSFLIFIVEALSIITSPFPISRKEVIRLQLVLPIVSFIIFIALPAGKKLFIITSLLFSLCYLIIRQLRYLLLRYFPPPEKPQS